MLLLGGLVLTAATGCGAGDASAEPTTPAAALEEPPTDIEFFADYSRYLWHRRRLVIATTNNSEVPIEISRIALRTGYFEPLAPEPKSTTIGPMARVDVQVDFGEISTCEHGPMGATDVEIGMGVGDGEPATYLVPIDPAPFDEIRDRECARRAVTDAASIEFSTERSIDAGVMSTAIVIERLGGSSSVRIDSLKGSVIIALQSLIDDRPLAVLKTDAAIERLPVKLFVARCEPHAVGQSTLSYELVAFVALGGSDAIRLPIEVDDQLRADLQAMIRECIAHLAGGQ